MDEHQARKLIAKCDEGIETAKEELRIHKILRNRFMKGLLDLKNENKYPGVIATQEKVLKDLKSSIKDYERDLRDLTGYKALLVYMLGDDDE